MQGLGITNIERLSLARFITALIVVTLIISSFTSSSYAANYPQNMAFQHPMPAEADSLGYVQDIFQDHEGFIWIGGRNGLLRYDGYEARLIDFKKSKDESTVSRSIDQVTKIYEDDLKTLWIATRNGLFIYDRDAGNIINIPESYALPQPIDTVDILGVANIGNVMVIGSGFQIWIYNRETKQTIDPNTDDSRTYDILHGQINTVTKDKVGNIWVTTSLGLYSINATNLGTKSYKPHAENPGSEEANAVKAMSFDHQGNMWLGLRNGLSKLDVKSGKFKHYTFDENKPNGVAGGGIQYIYQDSKDILWIGYENSGLGAYDFENDSFHHYKSLPNEPKSLATNSVKAILEDDNGDMWIGNYPNGIQYFDWTSTAIQKYSHIPNNDNSLSHNSIRAVQVDAKGNIWVGADGGGINHLDRKTNTITRLEHESDNPNSPSSNSTLSMILDKSGNIWSGSWAGGLNHFNTKTKKFTRLTTENSEKQAGISESDTLSGTNVWTILEDKDGHIWAGTHNGGLSRYNPRDKTFKHFKTAHPYEAPQSASDMIWSLVEDRKGRLWVGTVNGLQVLDRDEDKFKHYTEAEAEKNNGLNRILSLYEDQKGRIWAGTDGGLKLYLEKEDRFKIFAKKDGLVEDVIQSIIDDDEGNLWLGTSNGVTFFNPEENRFHHYAKHQGQSIGEMNSRSVAKNDKGEIIFGGTKGLWIFNTKKFVDNQRQPPIVLTDFKLFSKSVEVNGEDKLLAKSINNTDSITLDYTQNMFAFNFSALNFRQPENNQYAYKLEGFDKQWHQVGNNRQAVYTNLDAGQYTFKVKGSNNDRIWNETPKTIQIIQLPPPWKTWWAYTIYAFTIIATIWRFIHVQRAKRRMVEEQNRILEIKVAERTAQLRQKNEDIQSMLGNMHQGLFTILDDCEIHPEYSRYLETIFEEEKLAGMRAVDLLFKDSDLGEDAIWQVHEALSVMINEDVMNFEFNIHILPKEIHKTINQHKKILNLDWNPILSGYKITKIMVTVRDVTLLKKMEIEAENQRRELDIIGHLLNVSESKYRTFEQGTHKFIEENRKCIQENNSFSEKAVALLFRNMHTIKGNSRVFKFKYISDCAHHIEDRYSKMASEKSTLWHQELMLEELDELEKVFDEYNDVYHRVLSHDDNATRYDSDDGIWLENLTVDKILKGIDSNQLNPVKQLLESARSKDLKEVLSDVVISLPSIAKQLHKEAPKIDFEESDFKPKHAIHELLQNTFSHILRNAIDHGIEDAETREKKGKPAAGCIHISQKKNAEFINIRVGDDGQGMNITNLYKKGVKEGLIHPNDKQSADDIAQLIFKSGLSTKEKITDISGRGVGMDAVKQFLIDYEGDINVCLLDDQNQTGDFIPFELVISLPLKYFIEDRSDKNKVVEL